ncbi:MAG: zinc ribbon domain-containing protein [Candidatus Micrarchaeota archaeon]
MGLFDLLSGILGGGDGGGRPNIKAKCPKCGTPVNLSMKRCPGCGTHVDLLFRLKCPNCSTVNELKNERCKKCGEKLFDEEQETIHNPKYICPICGYRADFYMLQCPACGTRFS